ncbi:antitoxin Xre-like helix-turn-helix domain-containing protein [Pedobacter sp.]
MKSIKYGYPENRQMLVAAEPEALYATTPKLQIYQIKSFIHLNDLLPFSQAEWADILHISDRTLQRYLKDEKPFEGLHAEHLHQLENMASLAKQVIGKPDAVKSWLLQKKEVLGIILDFSSLRSFWGVKRISNELGRIAHGVYI